MCLLWTGVRLAQGHRDGAGGPRCAARGRGDRGTRRWRALAKGGRPLQGTSRRGASGQSLLTGPGDGDGDQAAPGGEGPDLVLGGTACAVQRPLAEVDVVRSAEMGPGEGSGTWLELGRASLRRVRRPAAWAVLSRAAGGGCRLTGCCWAAGAVSSAGGDD